MIENHIIAERQDQHEFVSEEGLSIWDYEELIMEAEQAIVAYAFEGADLEEARSRIDRWKRAIAKLEREQR